MERWCGRVALVTGASSGIGAAIARSLVKHGMKVVGCARNVDRVQAISQSLKNEKGQLYPIRCDVTNEDDILAMFQTIEVQHGGVDVCVNNAGLAHEAPLLSGETAKWKNMFDVNVIALSVCTREAVKSMRSKKVDDGHIVHIGSMAGHKVQSNSVMYSATKHAVKVILEGHRQELRALNSHIRVTSVSPGLVETEFRYRCSGPETAKQMYSSIAALQPSDIADSVIYALSTPPHVQVHDILMLPTEQK